jgi:AcrR family transcriptional regulator
MIRINMAGKGNRPRRAYDSSGRAAAAEGTRRAILAAARKLLIERGYAGMTMAAVASEAGIAVDTIYASIGRKPELVALLVESSISGSDQAVPAEAREYVMRIRAATDAGEKLATYAAAVRTIHFRLAPIVRALREAMRSHPGLGELWQQIADRRRRNMADFAADLAATGQVRPGLSQDELADLLWTMGAPEFYSLLVKDAGWSAERFESWLADAWRRLILAERD